MASIRKLPNGSFKATIFCGRDGNGKQIRKYITCPTYKECKIVAREMEIEFEENGLINITNIRFSQWAEKWLEIKKPEITSGTYISYKMYINTHFAPYFGNSKLSIINELQIRKYLSEKLNSLSPTTVRKHFFVLSDIFYMALKHKSPLKDIEAPKAEKYKPNVPSMKEFQTLHEAIKGMWDELPILLAAWCGLREGEIFALKRDDIDWNNDILRIDENRVISENGYVDGRPKSDRGFREIAVPKYLMNLLRQHTVNNMECMRLFNMRPDSYCSRFSKLIETHNRLWQNRQSGTIKKNKGRNKTALAEQIKLQNEPLLDIRFHDLRHYHATMLYKAQIPDQYAAQRLGHDIGVLKKIYQHLQFEEENKFDDKIKNLFEKSTP